jgi:AcrR family transcriptional regulator
MSEVHGLRERKKQRTRDTIVAAAMRLFAERGFDRTTIADIAEAADIAPRTFFAYFPSKEDVVFSDFGDSFEGLSSRLRGRRPGETAVDAMRSWIAELIGELDLDDETMLLRKRLACEHEAIAARDRHLRGRFEELLAEAVADDLGDPPTALRPRMVAAAALAALYSLEDADGDVGEDPMAQVDLALAFVRGGLAALQDTERP